VWYHDSQRYAVIPSGIKGSYTTSEPEEECENSDDERDEFDMAVE
jgi:hypothetical protein